MSVVGCCLAFPGWMLLLLDCNALGGGLLSVSVKAIGPCGGGVVAWFLPFAVGAVVINSDWWVEAMRVAVAAHVAELFHFWLFSLAFVGTSAVAVAVGVVIFVVAQFCSHGSDGSRQFF